MSAQFVAESFAVRTAAHLRHLSSDSYAQHMALGEFYDSLTETVDKYAEVYMGLKGQIKKWPEASPPKAEAVDLLTIYLGMVKDQQKADKDSQALLNILAELEELTGQTLYKLKFLR